MGLRAIGTHSIPDTLARRGRAIRAALRAQGFGPGESTRIAFGIRTLSLGWAGHRLEEARLLRALEALAGGPATYPRIIEAAAEDGIGRPMTAKMIQRGAARLRRVDLLRSRRTKNPGGGRGGTLSEYWLTPRAVLAIRQRNARRLRANETYIAGAGYLSG